MVEMLLRVIVQIFVSYIQTHTYPIECSTWTAKVTQKKRLRSLLITVSFFSSVHGFGDSYDAIKEDQVIVDSCSQ